MSNDPGVVYPPGTVDQPDEAPLPLRPRILDRVLAALDELAAPPAERVVRRRFIVALPLTIPARDLPPSRPKTADYAESSRFRWKGRINGVGVGVARWRR